MYYKMSHLKIQYFLKPVVIFKTNFSVIVEAVQSRLS